MASVFAFVEESLKKKGAHFPVLYLVAKRGQNVKQLLVYGQEKSEWFNVLSNCGVFEK